jgi:hypothetical protein
VTFHGPTRGKGEGGRGSRRGTDGATPPSADPGPILRPSSHKKVRRCMFLMGRCIKNIRRRMFLIHRSIKKIRRWMFLIGRSIKKVRRWMFLIGRSIKKIRRRMFLIGRSIEKIERWMFSAIFRADGVGTRSWAGRVTRKA